jgi:hypothetical protein
MDPIPFPIRECQEATQQRQRHPPDLTTTPAAPTGSRPMHPSRYADAYFGGSDRA